MRCSSNNGTSNRVSIAVGISLFNIPPASGADTADKSIDNVFLCGAPGSIKDRIYYSGEMRRILLIFLEKIFYGWWS
jgi:hypothetical protein